MGLFSSISKIITGRSDRYITTVLNNPNPYADIFGKSVAISGDYAVVGSTETNDIGTSGTAYVYDLSSNTPTTPIITLNHPEPEELVYGDHFSSTVAIDGDLVLVGANAEQGKHMIGYEDFTLQENAGRAHIFDINGKLTTDAISFDNPVRRFPSKDNFFGSQLAINQSLSIVGTNRTLPYIEDLDLRAILVGNVYVFNNKTGNLMQTLTSPSEQGSIEYSRFGSSVDIYGELAIVGAYGANDYAYHDIGSPPLPQESGKSYIFDVSTGSIVTTLENPNIHGISNGDQFGFSVGIYQHTAIVGAPGEDSGSPIELNNTGVVYVYDIASHNSPIVIAAPTNCKRFGHTVDICESYIAIGAPDIDIENEKDNGKIFIYERINLTEPYAVINNPNPEGIYPTDNFGCQVSISGKRVIANSIQEHIQDEDDYINPGRVYIFEIK